jgi:predicted RNA-binding Zn-ribbon protein involved in translation (DUF1610 family)
MTERAKMVCPDCGVEMNRHAEKVDYVAVPGEGKGEAFDEALGGVVEEFHACPECGGTQTRRAG